MTACRLLAPGSRLLAPGCSCETSAAAGSGPTGPRAQSRKPRVDLVQSPRAHRHRRRSRRLPSERAPQGGAGPPGARRRGPGHHGAASVDYPDFAAAVAERVASGACDRGILVCGTGIGMAMAANKIAGARAATVWNAEYGPPGPRAQRREHPRARRARPASPRRRSPWSASSSRPRSSAAATSGAWTRSTRSTLGGPLTAVARARTDAASRRRVDRLFDDDGPLARRSRSSSRAPGQRAMALAVARRHRGGRRAPGGGRHRHGQDARLPRSGHPQPPARPRLDRHQDPAGTDLRQGPSGAAGARSASRSRRPA